MQNSSTRNVVVIVPMEPSDLINCKKKAQKDVQMSSHARKYGEADTPLNTSHAIKSPRRFRALGPGPLLHGRGQWIRSG